ncbi:triphosphate tunnel metalloenzyme 3-like [Cornus florida]|uniref:triphosphate tunnel metalloenzyme 3-like n=1 Tax=Cornus florida TaxID=4283 RepID=UPI0028A2A513|nr:triphosphate tunnel metalloenzyme 3-like [Cornus florida]
MGKMKFLYNLYGFFSATEKKKPDLFNYSRFVVSITSFWNLYVKKPNPTALHCHHLIQQQILHASPPFTTTPRWRRRSPPPPGPPGRALQTNSESRTEQMEVEVKLRLPDSASHQRLSDLLSPFHSKTLLQENLFFDGAAFELSSNLAVLRLRFYDLDSLCVLSLKAKPQISAGISRVEEDEEPIDPVLGRTCVAEPWRLLSINSSRILNRVKEEFGVGEKGLVCLGGFRNVRAVYNWNGLKLELDETHYEFGTSYEIECESSEPDRAKKLLEELLNQHGISYSYSEVSKFAVFRSGKLPHQV